MRHIAAYLLLQIGGKTDPSAADVKKVLSAVGIDADEDRLSTLISELKGKSVDELIAEGSSKLASVCLRSYSEDMVGLPTLRFPLVEEVEVLLPPLLAVPLQLLLPRKPKKRRRKRRWDPSFIMKVVH